jgi:hypothetical protein
VEPSAAPQSTQTPGAAAAPPEDVSVAASAGKAAPLPSPRGSLFAAVRGCPGLCVVLGLYFLVAWFINPFREMANGDDWAYALTVRHLLETGEYQLNNWCSANMIVQAAWASLLAEIFGYSLGLLRFSTVLLFFFGLIACYRSLRDAGLKDAESGLLTLTVMTSPVVVIFTFSFMTDVQFLSWLLIAFWLYGRALRKHSYPLMALASAAAAAAIGTRQFGVALLGGLAVTWLLERQRLRKAPLYLVGMALPLLVGIWQVVYGLSHPTYFMTLNLQRQSRFLRDTASLAEEVLFWRPVALFQYLGLFLLPLLALGFLAVRRLWAVPTQPVSADRSGPCPSRWPAALLMAFWAVFIVAGVAAYSQVRDHLMPTIPLMIAHMLVDFPDVGDVSVPLTVLTAVFAVLLGWLFSKRYLDRQYWQARRQPENLLLFATLAWFGLQLVYVDYNDEYLLAAIPLGVSALGLAVPVWPNWCKVTTVILCAAMGSYCALRTRGDLEEEGAFWQAADKVRLAGVSPERIAAGRYSWQCYHAAAFDRWAEQVKGRPDVDPEDFFARFLPGRQTTATYVFAEPRDRPYTVLGRVPFTATDLRRQFVYIYRQTSVPVASGALDSVDEDAVYGWAWEPARPTEPIAVDIYDGDSLLGTVRADGFRADLRDNGIGDGKHVFSYPTPAHLKDGREHTIRVMIRGTNVELAQRAVVMRKLP